MPDLLSGLRYDEQEPMAPWEQSWNAALDDVREALTNLSDEQVRDIARYWLNEHYQTYDTITGQFRCVCGDTGDRDAHRIRVMFAAAVGGNEQESDSTLVWACARCGEPPEKHADPASDCLYMPILRRAGGDQ